MVNVIIASDPRYSVNKAAIQSAALQVLKKNGIRTRVELEVNIIGDRKMHELNKTYRGVDSTAEVLSFALEDPNHQDFKHLPKVGFVSSPDRCLRIGSILISYPQALEYASDEGTSVDDEILFLVEHGIKHLLGIHNN